MHPRLTFEFSPVTCRLLARHQGKAMPAWLIALFGSIARTKVLRISKLKTWDTVTVDDALHFMRGCDVMPATARRHREFIRRSKWRHLTSPYHRRLLLILYGSAKL